MKTSLFAMHRTVRIIREGPGSGFGFTLSGDSPVFVKSVDRGKCLFKVFVLVLFVLGDKFSEENLYVSSSL